MSILPNPIPLPDTIPPGTPHPSWCDPRLCSVVQVDDRSLRSHRGELFRDQWGDGVVAMQNQVVDELGNVTSTCRPMVFVDVDPTNPFTPDHAAELGYAMWTAP